MGKIRKMLSARGASAVEYALVIAVMAGIAYGGLQMLNEPVKNESAQQQACISQNPPPPPSENGGGCQLPPVSTTAPDPLNPVIPPTPPPTVPGPEVLSAPQNVVITPGYDSTGQIYYDVEFTPPANSTDIPVGKYQYTTDFVNSGPGLVSATWRDRSDGGTGSPMRIVFRSETFNQPLNLAEFFSVGIRAVDQDGRPGKRSAVWRVGTPRAKMDCGNGNFCSEKFSIQRSDIPGEPLKGVHRLDAAASSQVGALYFGDNTNFDALVVGGGGGGGGNGGGGGGGGGVVYQSGLAVRQVTQSRNYYILLAGEGGAAGSSTVRGGAGVPSIFEGLFVQGGGGGSSRDGAAATPPCPSTRLGCPTTTFSSRAAWDAPDGLWSSLVVEAIASAGGGANTTTGYRRAGGNGRTGQGNNAGWGCSNNGADCGVDGGGGGGGGASSIGGAGLLSGTVRGGAGGAGVANSIEGWSLLYGAGGGGGKTVNGTAGLGGSCTSADTNGCVGGSSRTDRRNAGQDGRGGGGAGGSGGNVSNPSGPPGRGGGGVVVIRYSIQNIKVAEAES